MKSVTCGSLVGSGEHLLLGITLNTVTKWIPAILVLGTLNNFELVGYHPLPRTFGQPTVIRRSPSPKFLAIGGHKSIYLCTFSDEVSGIVSCYYFKHLHTTEIKDIVFMNDCVLAISTEDRYLTEIKLDVE